jgi:signal transduction histidine kinase
VVVPTLLGIAYCLRANGDPLTQDELLQLVIWVFVVALVELIAVPMWRGTTLSMGFPLLMCIGFLYIPPATALVAFLAASDPRELKREVGLLQALFNRCQVALSVWAASAIFHSLAAVDTSSAPTLVGAAALAAVADYLVNATLVCIGASLYYEMPPLRVIRELRVGRLSEFVISYLGLAVLGLILARFFSLDEVGFWVVPISVIPLLLARQMFFRSKALEEAHKELKDREQVLRALSNRMAEERQDERAQIAAYLHDDLAQLLFRMSIQVDVARRHLIAGRLEQTETTLDEIKETKSKTSDRIRALIRDLHRSPLGRAGLAEALHGFIVEAARESDVRFHTDIAEVELPPPIALLLYHIACEGVMNALKHANAANMWLTVKQDGDTVELTLQDDGVGFDSDAPEPEGHYGLTMMRERALVGGGTFHLASEPGGGATIKVSFPTSWLQEEAKEPEEPHRPPPPGASPDSGPAPSREQAPQSALA